MMGSPPLCYLNKMAVGIYVGNNVDKVELFAVEKQPGIIVGGWHAKGRRQFFGLVLSPVVDCNALDVRQFLRQAAN